jgi:hypothetical protein
VQQTGTLRLGQTARAKLLLNVHRGVPAVPISALQRTEGGGKDGPEAAVSVVKDGKTQLRKIRVGARDDRHAEVKSGLELGEQVVVSGGYSLPDGTPVTFDGGRP